MTRTEQIDRILRSLPAGTPDIEACALISEDGLMIASALPQHIEEVRVAGMSSTLMSLGTRAALELERGSLDQVLIRGPSGYAVMMSAAAGTMLLVLASRSARLGLIFLDMDRTTREIARVL